MTTQRTPMPVHTADEHSILDNIIAQTLLSADDEAYGIAKRGVSAFIEELIKPQNRGEPVKKRLVDRMIAEIDTKLSLQMDEILHHPQHPYTQLLISAVPDPEKSIHAELEGGRKGEIPLWTPESCGCPFAGRCNQAMPRCKEALPPITKLADNHFVRCYLYE